MAHVVLSPSKIDVQALIDTVSSPEVGGLVLFIGTVRSSSEAMDDVEEIEFQADTGTAVNEMESICSEAEARWGAELAVHHRIGTIRLGEMIVCIVAAAPHRAEAFEAARYVIDEIKKRAPIWKKEIGSGGDYHWVAHP